MSSENPSSAPAAPASMTRPAAASFRFVPPPRQSLRAALLGSTSLASGVVVAPKVQARPHVQ